MSLRFRYQPPNLAISTLYWKAWPLLLVVAAFNPENIGEPPSGQLAVTPLPPTLGAALNVLSGLPAYWNLGWSLPGDWAVGWDPRWAGVLCAGRHPQFRCSLGLAAWEEYPTLKMLMEMVMTK